MSTAAWVSIGAIALISFIGGTFTGLRLRKRKQPTGETPTPVVLSPEIVDKIIEKHESGQTSEEIISNIDDLLDTAPY